MNILQNELDSINQKLELLLYRKQQLDSIISEYSDVVNRVRNLVSSMEDAMVEPTNLLMEIEGIIHSEPEQTQQPETTDNHTKINSYIIPFDPLIHSEPEPTPGELEQPTEVELTPELKPTEKPTTEEQESTTEPEHFNFDLRLFPKAEATEEQEPDTVEPEALKLNTLGLPIQTEAEPVKLMAMVPTVATEQTPIKTQLNERAWQRNNTLLIGFPNKKLLKIWSKWFIENWGDSLFISDDSLEEFSHCLSVLWYKNANWERLKALDYSQSPDNQELIKTPDFEFKKATETTTQIFRDGVLLGLAKNCDGHWESPQFKGEQFDLIQDIADRMWELINQF